MTGAVGRDDPMVVAALRSPIGTAGKALRDLTAAELAAPVLAAVAADLSPLVPVEVVLGNCMGPGGDVARVATLAAGLGYDVPALTVDRQCASGLAAIEVATALVHARGGVVLAGGVESASTAPWRCWPPGPGGSPVRYERAPFAPTDIGDPDMGVAADLLAAEHGVGRERQDAFAARSHQRAWAATEEGLLDDELVPVGGLARDERPRKGMTAQRLARLPAAFREGGTVTAGNSCGVNDGAAVVALAPASTGLPGLRVLATATTGVDPNRPGRGLVPAVRAALDRAGLGLDDLDVVELNEAFAGQVLACCDELGLADDRVCPQGGALALGHPWGASGAVLVVRLFSQLVRQGRGRYGLAAIAAGGGQGVAMVVEACR
ncbi:MAG TPA: thiolase family protein [Marmoricola sp.]|nr:thiolase family protein [Marmoricola sp.]